MKIFITGATGFIGGHFAKRMAGSGHEIICGGRSPAKLNSLPREYNPVRIYLEHKETISRVLKKEHPDIVCHAAALVESSSLEKLRRVNVEGTKNVLDACLALGIKKVIYVSSVAVISGNKEVPLTDDLPYKATNAYGRSKVEAEKVAIAYRKKGLKVAILRPCMVYGEDEPHALHILIKWLKRRTLPIFGEGNNKLQLVSVENVVDVMVLCLSKDGAYEGTYLVADKEVLSIKELFYCITLAIGAKSPIHVPRIFVELLAKLPVIGRRVSFFLKDRTYSIDRIKEKLGYIPRVSTCDGLKKAVLSLRKRGNSWQRY